MELANLTNDDARYTVRSGGSSVQATRAGHLKPHDYAVERLPQQGPWRVEFQKEGKVVATGVVESPKASVTLAAEAGRFKIQASVAPIDALIIYTPSIKKWAEKLDLSLREQGLSTWIDYRDLKTGVSAWEQLEKAIEKTKNIVVLIGKKDDATERQRIAAAVALGAVYEDLTKRMIPLLLGAAELPVLVRAAAHWTRPIPAIRVARPSRDWDQAVADLIEVLKSEADPRTKGEVIDTTKEDRRLRKERMAYIKRVVDELKLQEERASIERQSARTA